MRTGEGFLHLAAVMDLHSGMVVGWAMASHLRTELVVDALEMAITRRRPEDDPLSREVSRNREPGKIRVPAARNASCDDLPVVLNG